MSSVATSMAVRRVAVPSWLRRSQIPCQSRTGVERGLYAERDYQPEAFGLLHMLVDPPMAAGRARTAQLDDVGRTVPHIRISRPPQLTVMATASWPA